MSIFVNLIMNSSGRKASNSIKSSLSIVDSALATTYVDTFTTKFEALTDDQKTTIDSLDVTTVCSEIESEASLENAYLSNGISSYPNCIPLLINVEGLLDRIVTDCGAYKLYFCARLHSYSTIGEYITGAKEPDANYPYRYGTGAVFNTGLKLTSTSKIRGLIYLASGSNQTIYYPSNSGYTAGAGGCMIMGRGNGATEYMLSNDACLTIMPGYINRITLSSKGAIDETYNSSKEISATYTVSGPSLNNSSFYFRNYSPNQGCYCYYYWASVYTNNTNSVSAVTDADTETNRFLVISSGLLYDVLNHKCIKT